MAASELAAARSELRSMKRELAEGFAEATHLKNRLKLIEDEGPSCTFADPSPKLGRDVISVLKLVHALGMRNEQSSSWRKQNTNSLGDYARSLETVMHNSKVTLESLEQARSERESCLLDMKAKQEQLEKAVPSANVGATSREILRAIQESVKFENGKEAPLTLQHFAGALRNNDRVAQLLKADTKTTEVYIEAINSLEHSLGATKDISNSVLIDLLFSPEAETEKLLSGMQKGKHGHPSWKLDHKWQNKAMDTLEASLQKKLDGYLACEKVLSKELAELRAGLKETEADEQQEMSIVAAFAAAQREKAAVKQEQKIQLEHNRNLRKKSPMEELQNTKTIMGADMLPYKPMHSVVST